MNPIVILLFNYSIIVINRLSLGPSIGSSDHSYFSVNTGRRKCLFSRWHYASIPVELLWQIVTIEFAALLSVWRRVTVSARGLNSIKCIDYLSLLHDNNATRHYTTCPPSLLCWQFLGVKATTDHWFTGPQNKWEQAPRGFQSSLQYLISSGSLFQATDLSEFADSLSPHA